MFLRFPKKLNVYLVLYICLIISIIGAHWIWFFSSSVLTSGDWGFVHKGQGADWLPFPSIWSTVNFGSVNPFFANSPIELILRVLTDFVSYGFALRAVYFVPTILFSIVSIHFLSNELHFSIPAKIAALSIYVCSTPMIMTRTGHNTLAAAYAVAPLIIVTFKRSLKKPISIYTLLTPILCALMSAYEPRAFYLLFFILLIISAQSLFSFFRAGRLLSWTLLHLFIGCFFIFASAYWLLPFVMLSGRLGEGVIGRGLFGTNFASFLSFLTLHHPFWNGGKYEPFVVQLIHPAFFLTPILVILGLVTARRNGKILPFVIILLIGLFLGKQDNPPFGSVYGALYMYFPGLNAFRESSKFYFYSTLATALIVGNLFNELFSSKRSSYPENLTRHYVGLLLLASLVVIYLFNLVPLANGRIGALFVARHMPDDYPILNNYLSKNQGTFRVMGIPTMSRWVVRSDRVPAVAFYDIVDSTVSKRFPHLRSERDLSNRMSQVILDDGFIDYLNESSIRYIVVPLKDTPNDDNFYIYFNNNRSIFIDSLDRTKLKNIDLDMKEVRLYENPFYKERIDLDEPKESEQIKGTFINSSTFKIELSGVEGNPLVIRFREKYDLNWKMYQSDYPIDSFSILTAKPLPNYHQPDKNNWNTFTVNVADLCKQRKIRCVEHNGGYSLELLMAYEPQRFVIIGYVISAITITILFVGFALIFGFQYKIGSE